jgi:hypothetical protein
MTHKRNEDNEIIATRPEITPEERKDMEEDWWG